MIKQCNSVAFNLNTLAIVTKDRYVNRMSVTWTNGSVIDRKKKNSKKKNQNEKAFLRSLFNSRCRNEIEILEKSVQKDCVDISKSVQNETETRLTELSELYNEAKEKIRCLEEETMEASRQKEFFQSRTRELANLLTTLEHFDLEAKTVCRLTSEGKRYLRFSDSSNVVLKFIPVAVENLTEVGLSFEETVKKLRQFTWKVDNRKSATEVDTLRSQNLILREIVKSLKRKAQFRSENQSSRLECSKQAEENREKMIERSNDSCGTKIDINDVQKSNDELSIESKTNLHEKNNLVVNVALPPFLCDTETNVNESTKPSKPLPVKYNCENKDIVSSANGKEPCIESLTNEIFFDEYVIRFSNSRQMKIKHSPEASAKTAHLKLEFLDSEDKYQESSPDKVLILLKNLCASIKIGDTTVNCSTRTMLTQKCNNIAQTTITDMRDFPRFNIGCYRMLNSEKRAIERNLSNLERTIADLKSDTLHHARSMIGRKSKYSKNDQFFQCIERLAED